MLTQETNDRLCSSGDGHARVWSSGHVLTRDEMRRDEATRYDRQFCFMAVTVMKSDLLQKVYPAFSIK